MIDAFDPIFTHEVPAEFHSFSNFAEVIRWRAEQHPDAIAYTFLADGEDDEENITFGELERRVRIAAAHIRRQAPVGSRALLIYDSGIDYIVAILGCFAAGVIAVPVYPPDPWRFQTTLERLEVVLADSQASLLLTTGGYQQAADDLLGRCPDLKKVIATDQIDHSRDEAMPETSVSRDDPALLQYTSGSTGAPKGVIVSHGNLLFNSRHIQRFDEPHAVIVSWLPMYHDMGLMGMVLQTVHSGRRLVLMSPVRFVERPFRWLRAVSKYRAYSTCGPNFAFDMCVRKIPDEDLAGLDLNCLTLAVTGAEPIRPETLDRFAKRFAPYGFDRKAFYPSFGLAEATLIVSGGEKYAPPVVKRHNTNGHMLGQAVTEPATSSRQQRALVGCGKAIDQVTIEIVDPETRRPCPAGAVGEIWVAGPGVAQGYWNQPEKTRETFRATLADTGEGPFMRTGDLGYLDDGELFVTGRIKDTIILRGHNYYPQDIEQTVQQCDRHLDNQVGAAFSVERQDGERLVVVQEVRRTKKLDAQGLLKSIRRSVQQEHQIRPVAVALVPRGAVPKTSSGKIRRAAYKSQYLTGELEILAKWTEEELSASANAAVRATTTTNGHGKANSNGHAIEAANGHATGAAPWETLLDAHRRGILAFLTKAFAQLDHCVLPHRLHGELLLFADLGLESIDAVELLARIETQYRCRIPFDEFFAEVGQRQGRDVTIGELLDFLDLQLPAEPKTADVSADAQSHVEVNGAKLFYRQEGVAGPQVVLIHGIGGNLTGWYLCSLMRELAKNFRVTAYDLRGHGRSDVPESGYSSRTMAADLVGLLDGLGIERPYLMGHSYGATVALHAAVEHPDRVAGVVLSDAYLPGLRDVHGSADCWMGWERYQTLAREVGLEVSDEWDNLEPLFEQVAALSPEDQQKFVEIADPSTLHRLARLALTTCGRDVKSSVGLGPKEILAVTHPVVCLYGERSPFRPLCDYLTEQLPNCTEAIVPGAEHFGFDENPAEYVRLSVHKLSELAGIATAADSPALAGLQRQRRTIFAQTGAGATNGMGPKGSNGRPVPLQLQEK